MAKCISLICVEQFVLTKITQLEYILGYHGSIDTKVIYT